MSNIRRPVFLLTLLNLFASGAGFIREIVTAYYYGTSAAADAFSVVMFYLDAVGVVFQYGLASYMLVPLVTGLIARNESEEGFRVIESISLWLAAISAPLIVIVYLYPRWVAGLLVPKFSEVQLTYLTRLLGFSAVALLLIILGSLISGFLRAHSDFYSAVIGRACFSFFVAASLVVAGRRLGITAAAVGILIGALAQSALIVRGFRKLGWRLQKPSWSNSLLRAAVPIGLPSTLALVMTNMLMGGAQRFIASGLPEGGLAAVNYAQRTLSLVSGFTLSLVTVSLTELSMWFHTEKGMGSKGLKSLRDSLNIGFFILVPLSFLLFAFSEPIIALLFRRGQYDVHSLQTTAECLKWFAIAVIPGMVVGQFQGAVCPVFQRHWAVFLIGAIQTVVTVLLTYLLLAPLNVAAMPVGLLAGYIAASLASVAVVWDLVGGVFLKSVALYALKVALLASMSLAILLWFQLLPTASAGWTPWSAIEAITKSGTAFMLVFCSMSFVARDPYMLTVVEKGKQFLSLRES